VKATISKVFKNRDVSYSSYTSGGGGYIGPNGGHIDPVTTKTTRHEKITQRLYLTNIVFEDDFPYPRLKNIDLDYKKIQRIDEKFSEGDEVSIVYLMHDTWRKKLKDEFDTSPQNDGLALSLIRNESTSQVWDFYPGNLMERFYARVIPLLLAPIVILLTFFLELNGVRGHLTVPFMKYSLLVIFLVALYRFIVSALLRGPFKKFISDIASNSNHEDGCVSKSVGIIPYIRRNKKLLSALDKVKNNPEINEIIQKAKNRDELIEYANKIKDNKEVNEFLNKIKDNKDLDGYLESMKSNEDISKYIDKIKSQKKLSNFFKWPKNRSEVK